MVVVPKPEVLNDQLIPSVDADILPAALNASVHPAT